AVRNPRLSVEHVACHAGEVVDERAPPPQQPVEERGLADVRAPHDNDGEELPLPAGEGRGEGSLFSVFVRSHDVSPTPHTPPPPPPPRGERHVLRDPPPASPLP